MLINWMRDKAPVIMGFVLVAFILTIFVSWGAGGAGIFGGNNVGKIEGEKISFQNFRMLYDRYRRMSDEMSPSQRREFPEEVWNSLVDERIRQNIIEKLGLEVSQDEAVRFLLENPDPRTLGMDQTQFQEMFADQQTGEVDIRKYQSYIAENSQYLQRLITDLQSQRIPSMRVQSIFRGAFPSAAQQEYEYGFENDRIVFQYIVGDASALSIDEELDMDRVTAMYEEFAEANSGREMANIAYLKVPKDITEEDRQYVREDMNYVYRRLKEENVDFAEEAQIESHEERTAQNGGYLGAVSPDDDILPSETAELLFDSPTGFVSRPVYISDSPYLSEGFHIFKVLQRQDETIQLGHIYKEVVISPDREMDIDSETADIFEFARTKGIKNAAEEFGLSLDTTGHFGRGDSVPEINYLDELGRFVFDEDEGDMDVFYGMNRPNYVVELIDRKRTSKIELSEFLHRAEKPVRDSMRVEKMLTLMQEKAGEVAGSETPYDEMEFSQEYFTGNVTDTVTRASFGNREDITAISAAFGLPRDAGVPFVVAGDTLKVYAVMPLWKDAAEEMGEDERDRLLQRLTQQNMNRAYDEWLTYRKGEMDIENNIREYYY
ncbi:MAG: peptidylprolyl isomerase [Fibrobacterota bacterium]